jgi:hypothetical protein
MSLTPIIKVGLQLAVAVAASVAIAAPALAAPGGPAGTGTFKTWGQAQHAAGFSLVKPGTTYGLKNVGHITVGICEVPGKLSKRVVSASYGSFGSHSFALVQDNAGRLCGGGGYAGTYLGSYKIHGIKAKLYGFCNVLGGPLCTNPKVELWLTWSHKASYYIASSFNESRKRLVTFATDLKKV